MGKIMRMKRIFMFLLLFATAAIILIFTTASSNNTGMAKQLANTHLKGFALIELFTSQGCSSCPPADRLLGQYAVDSSQHIIALSFHVDYWNRLGWTDPFSNTAYADRQRRYAHNFNNETVYTPQAVVNGYEELVGSNVQKMTNAIGHAITQQHKVIINISDIVVKDAAIGFTYTISGTYQQAVVNMALVQQRVATYVRAGENRGEHLINYNVVRDFKTIQARQSAGTGVLALPAGASASGYSIVVFLQQEGQGEIIGVAKHDI
jgi:hypothetical protein